MDSAGASHCSSLLVAGSSSYPTTSRTAVVWVPAVWVPVPWIPVLSIPAVRVPVLWMAALWMGFCLDSQSTDDCPDSHSPIAMVLLSVKTPRESKDTNFAFANKSCQYFFWLGDPAASCRS